MAFGDFTGICSKTPLPLCSLIGSVAPQSEDYSFAGIIPKCYARSINLANTLIFQVGTAFIHIATLVVLLTIIYNTRSKITAVGRKEMLFFFWNYISLIILSLVVDTGVTPPGSTSYSWFVAAQMAEGAVCCWSLFYAGVTSLNFWSDGSINSMSFLYISSIAYFAVNYAVAILTFHDWTPGVFSSTNTMGLFILTYIVNGIFLLGYILVQYFVCFFTLVLNWWAVGALTLSAFFFGASQVLIYAASQQICLSLKHYVDGLIFAAISDIFCIMMIYKYWEIITFDDDEYTRTTEVVAGIGSKEKAQTYFN